MSDGAGQAAMDGEAAICPVSSTSLQAALFIVSDTVLSVCLPFTVFYFKMCLSSALAVGFQCPTSMCPAPNLPLVLWERSTFRLEKSSALLCLPRPHPSPWLSSPSQNQQRALLGSLCLAAPSPEFHNPVCISPFSPHLWAFRGKKQRDKPLCIPPCTPECITAVLSSRCACWHMGKYTLFSEEDVIFLWELHMCWNDVVVVCWFFVAVFGGLMNIKVNAAAPWDGRVLIGAVWRCVEVGRTEPAPFLA